jgi:hypothetical protein
MSKKSEILKAAEVGSGRRLPADDSASALVGEFDQGGQLIDHLGNVMRRTTSSVTINDALALIRDGAHAATEACGCGGWQGCQPVWLGRSDLDRSRAGGKPRRVKSNAKTWIDVWRSDASVLVFAHGDIRWDTKDSPAR